LHPSPSIILFTSAAGAGYGLLFLLGLGAAQLLPPTRAFGLAGLALALTLISAGLLASLGHLGHPERAWRAIGQWRSSWLSREGALALLTFIPALVLAFGWVVLERTEGWFALAGALAALGAAATVWATGMIYASLKPVREWHRPLTAPLYLAFALMSGALLLHLLLAAFDAPRTFAGVLALLATLLAFGLKAIQWQGVAAEAPASTPETATGLGQLGLVRMIEPPHTQTNYLLTEMGFQLGRKHAARLRLLAYALGLGGGALLTLLALAMTGLPALVLTALAAAGGLAAIVIERWLFFAEATHTAMLYYGRRPGAAQAAG
jgi:sulfite dehydrogenase (quinone) subunit SoeC